MLVEFEYWWLLILPLFFTLGWIAARVDIRQIIADASALPAAYFKGLNHLISNRPDKAAEAFTEAVNINNNSLDLHFALGGLFRRTGETDQAIHLHLNLLEKKELSEAQKIAIKAELAQDYLKAGLYDRAEEIYLGLNGTRYHQPALHALLEIYVREREWSQAIDIATELERLSGVPFRKEIAQYNCELALNASLSGNDASAKMFLVNALDANKNCVRANVLLGDIEAKAGAHPTAISYWKKIEYQKPEYLGLVANKMLKSYSAMQESKAGLKEGLTQLNQYLEAYDLPSLMSALYEATLAEDGAEAAAKIARNALIRKPSLKTLDQLLQARAMDNDNQKDIQLMQQTVRNAIGDRVAYHCDQCGFSAKQYHWQCPACNAWESLPTEPSENPSRDIKLIKRI
jgi:lipopolysaccharide assembly protein B